MNIENEKVMKELGEAKVWKEIYTKAGTLKTVSSTQIGQQIVLDEALRVLPFIKEWIEDGSANVYKFDLLDYFQTDDIILTKLAEVYFFLSGGIYGVSYTDNDRTAVIKTRYKKIDFIKKSLFPDLDFNLVWRFVEIAIDYSNYFQTEKSFSKLTDKSGKSHFKTTLNYTCTISEKIINKLSVDALMAFYPIPMLKAPIDWEIVDGNMRGGYENYQYDLIRTNTFKVDYDNIGPKIYESVNYIQSIPWRVNNDMLKIVRNDLKFPQKDDYIKLEFPDAEECLFEIDLKDETNQLDEDLIIKIKEARRVYSVELELYNAEALDLESAIGKYRAVKMAVDIAERYIDIDIWFPHNYDFRGRIYPISIGLSPQSSDAVKAMLDYRDGEELNDDGLKWAWAYLASLFGDDKLDFDERVSRGKDLLLTDYLEADEPYQFKSHQIEMHKYFDEEDYKFKGRVHLDACNSGSQFTSAITGDIAGCLATNVLPTIDGKGGQIRQDAYMLVANKALDLCQKEALEDSNSEIKDILLMFVDILTSDGRKICKTPVMVSNYGGTEMGRANILWNMFRELEVDKKFITKKNSSIFARLIGDSIQGVLTGGKKFEIYIHKMNNILASKNRAITWMMYDGFHVTHVKPKEMKTKKITCWLPNSRKKTVLNKKEYSHDKVSSMKMKSAISPNYIHSLDAELLRTVALKMKEAGIINSDWIHDSFGCHPNYVTQMLEITKNEFRKMVRRNPLTILDKQLRDQVPSHNVKMLAAISKIKKPTIDNFDGRTGILDDVINSDWFFS